LKDETGYITGFVLASLLFKEVKTFQKQNLTVQLVEALHYKPVDRGYNSWWCHRNFTL